MIGGTYELLHDFVRMECRGSAEPAEKHLSGWALIARTPARQIRAGKTVDDGVVFKCLLQRIEPRYPIVGAHPEIAPLIFEDATDYVASQTISLVVHRERAGCGVELVESVLRAGPDPSGAVDVRRIHPVVAQRMWITAGRICRPWIDQSLDPDGYKAEWVLPSHSDPWRSSAIARSHLSLTALASRGHGRVPERRLARED